MKPEEYAKLSLILPFIPCPNCKAQLVPKEKTLNLCNVQCTSCGFAVRFVTLGQDDPLILSINALDLDALMASKTMLPPFIFHRRWKHEGMDFQFENATFYPFIPYTFLQKPSQAISLTGQQHSDVLLFVLWDEVPNEIIYNSPSDEEIAEQVSRWEKLSVARVQSKFHTGYARSARIIDEANKMRRKKGLPIEEFFSEEEDDSDEDDE